MKTKWKDRRKERTRTQQRGKNHFCDICFEKRSKKRTLQKKIVEFF